MGPTPHYPKQRGAAHQQSKTMGEPSPGGIIGPCV
jgi:hypothetical protein